MYQLPSGFDLPSLDFATDGSLYTVGDTPSGNGLIKIDVGAQSYEYVCSLQRWYPDLCFDASGDLFGSDGDELLTIDPLGGGETLIGSIGFSGVNGIEFSSKFRLELVYALPYARPGYLTWWKIKLANVGDYDVFID